MLKKAAWIAKELEADKEDVYDVLLGNITKPKNFVREVMNLSETYDNEMRDNYIKIS